MTQNAAEIKTECACTCIIVECMCSKDGYIPDIRGYNSLSGVWYIL